MPGILIFVASLGVYLAAPQRQVTDSLYSMLLSETLLRERTFRLEGHVAQPGPQLEAARGHLYYRYPPGTSILSAPLVAVLNAAGISAIGPDGRFERAGEEALQTALAAFLSAGQAMLFWLCASLVLPSRWAVLVALAGAFGTQTLSTMSRGMWSHTWEGVLLGMLTCLLLGAEARRTPLRPGLLGVLASALVWVRPTGALPLAATAIYLGAAGRGPVLRFAAAAAAGLGALFLYSLSQFGTLLPSYYLEGRNWSLSALPQGLLGQLLSPSRGLLVYVPALLPIGASLLRPRRRVPYPRLAGLALGCIGLHLATISAWTHWWGGDCYGPRLSSCLVPWFVLLGALALRAGLDAPRARWRRLQAGIAGGCVLLGVALNAIGAWSRRAWDWNQVPAAIDRTPQRLWRWDQAQFLAGLLWPLPGHYPTLASGEPISFGVQAEPYLWSGWSAARGTQRRSVGPKATILFALEGAQPELVRLRLQANRRPARVRVELNGRLLATFTVRVSRPRVYTIRLPEPLPRRNSLALHLPRSGITAWWLQLESRRATRTAVSGASGPQSRNQTPLNR
jgi:hypothetical protein